MFPVFQGVLRQMFRNVGRMFPTFLQVWRNGLCFLAAVALGDGLLPDTAIYNPLLLLRSGSMPARPARQPSPFPLPITA